MSRIIFFNSFHVGDIVISKPIVRELIKYFPDREPLYAHYNNEFITSDLCSYLHPSSIPTNNDVFKLEYNGDIIFNTWLGTTSNKQLKQITNSNPVVSHLDFQIDQFNYLLRAAGHNINLDYILQTPEKYIWEIENKYINDSYKITTSNNVLIYNMNSLSNQADNADHKNYIYNTAIKFPNTTFYTTNIDVELENVIHLNKFNQKGIDLFQFAEFSKNCNIIIGNGSGPLMFSWLKSNILNPNKTYIINHRYNDGECMLYSKQPAKSIRVYSTKMMFNKLEEILNGIQ